MLLFFHQYSSISHRVDSNCCFFQNIPTYLKWINYAEVTLCNGQQLKEMEMNALHIVQFGRRRNILYLFVFFLVISVPSIVNGILTWVLADDVWLFVTNLFLPLISIASVKYCNCHNGHIHHMVSPLLWMMCFCVIDFSALMSFMDSMRNWSSRVRRAIWNNAMWTLLLLNT